MAIPLLNPDSVEIDDPTIFHNPWVSVSLMNAIIGQINSALAGGGGGMQIATKTCADLTGFESATAFTITGDVSIQQVWGRVGATKILSDGDIGALSLSGDPDATDYPFQSPVDINGTNFDAG